MFEFPDIPSMIRPDLFSTISFCVIVLFVVACCWFGVCIGAKRKLAADASDDSIEETQAVERSRQPLSRAAVYVFTVGLILWLVIGALLPLLGVLRWNVVPPPGLLFVPFCLISGALFAYSRLGTRLTELPYHWLIGFQVFRLPLELILHHWYKVDSIPVQMTFEGYNFDIVTGLLAIVLGLWAMSSSKPKLAAWIFNVIGTLLLITVMLIAITSVPTPFRQFTNDPPLLLPFYFPYSYIVSVAVTGAMVGHLVLFRKLRGA